MKVYLLYYHTFISKGFILGFQTAHLTIPLQAQLLGGSTVGQAGEAVAQSLATSLLAQASAAATVTTASSQNQNASVLAQVHDK